MGLSVYRVVAVVWPNTKHPDCGCLSIILTHAQLEQCVVKQANCGRLSVIDNHTLDSAPFKHIDCGGLSFIDNYSLGEARYKHPICGGLSVIGNHSLDSAPFNHVDCGCLLLLFFYYIYKQNFRPVKGLNRLLPLEFIWKQTILTIKHVIF